MASFEAVLETVIQLKAEVFPVERTAEDADQSIAEYEGRIVDTFNLIVELASQHEDAQQAFGDISVIRLICGVLDHKSSSSVMTKAALLAWMKIIRRDTLVKATCNWDNCDRSEEHIISLVPFLRSHFQDPLIALYGCSLIMMLASDSDSRQFKFGLIGTPKVVVSILNEHRGDPNVMEMALRATRNLSSLDQVAAIFVQAAAGSALCGILTDASQPINVIESALYALINLSFDAENSATLGKEGACEATVECGSRWVAEGSALSLELSWAVRNLSAADENTARFVGHAFTPLLITSIMQSSQDAETLQMVLWGAANLCCNHTLAQSFLQHNLLDSFQHILHFSVNSFTEDIHLGPILEALSFTVYNLASSFVVAAEEAGNEMESAVWVEEIGQRGGCRIICDIFSRYVDREAMAESCCRSLHLLAKGCPSNQQLICLLGGLATLCQAAWIHRAVPETVFLSWKALLTICAKENAQTREALAVQQDVLAQTAALVQHYHEIDELLILGCSLLLILPYYQDKKEALRTDLFIDEEDKIAVREDRQAMLRAFEIDAITSAHPRTVAAPAPASASAALAPTTTTAEDDHDT